MVHNFMSNVRWISNQDTGMSGNSVLNDFKANEPEEISVFLTPPLSDEPKIQHKVLRRVRQLEKTGDGLPIFKLPDDDDDQECSLKKQNSIDFINEFYKRSLSSVIIRIILKQLTDMDLVSELVKGSNTNHQIGNGWTLVAFKKIYGEKASHVSKIWRAVIRYCDIDSGKRVRKCLRTLKNKFVSEKENNQLRANGKKLSTSSVSIHAATGRVPFSNNFNNITVNNNQVSRNSKTDENIYTTPKATLKPSKDLYRKCPECQTPARTTFKQVGHCTKCDQDFCLHCFYKNNQHSPTCQVVGGGGIASSPHKLSSQPRRFSLGSSGNKARLKRL